MGHFQTKTSCRTRCHARLLPLRQRTSPLAAEPGLQCRDDGFGVSGDHIKIGSRDLVRLSTVLLPISQSARWGVEGVGELGLRHA